MSSGRPTILVSVRWGASARLILRSRVVNYLAEMGCRVIIASPVADTAALKEEFEQENIIIESLRLPRERWHDLSTQIYSYLFRTMLPTASSAVREEQMRISNPRQYAIVRRLKGRPLDSLFRLWRWASKQALDNNLNQHLIEKYSPDLVVVSSLGRRLEDFYLLRLAKRHKVRTLCAIESWDTLTTKEYVYERPDKLVVWNEGNRVEACSLHGFAAESVHVTGPPQFDLYAHPQALPTRYEHLASLGLDPERHLLFMTGQPFVQADDIEASMQALARGLNEGFLQRPCQVLFRPHPAVYFGNAPGLGTESDLQRFEKSSPYIKADRPLRSSTGLINDTAAGETLRTAATLFHMAMLLDFFGTLSVEACTVNKPVIYLGLGNDEGVLGQESIQRRTGFTHVQLLLKGGAGRLVRTPEDLINAINHYLDNPGLDAVGRKKVAHCVAYKQDGQAGRRMALAIHSYACGLWPPAHSVETKIDEKLITDALRASAF